MATRFTPSASDPDVDAINHEKAQAYYDRVLWQGRARRAAQEQLSAESPEGPTPPLPGPGRINRSVDFLNRNSGQLRQMGSVPRGVPRFMANRNIILMAWFVGMVLVASDEWKNGFHFPRPARFWWTSATYGILMLVSQIDSLVPICNALAIGFDVQLMYENVSGNSLTLFGVNLSGNTTTSATANQAQPQPSIAQPPKTNSTPTVVGRGQVVGS